jgi:hypothetical protein
MGKIFVPKKLNVTGQEKMIKKKENDECSYSAVNIIWGIVSKGMKWEGYVARVEREENCIQGFC